LVEDPLIFAGDLLFDGAAEVVGEDAPGIGFDFEVVAGVGVLFAPGEDLCGVVAGGAEGWGGFRIEGDVEVDAGFLMEGGVDVS